MLNKRLQFIGFDKALKICSILIFFILSGCPHNTIQHRTPLTFSKTLSESVTTDYREYGGFSIWINCNERLAKATYTYIEADKDSYNRSQTKNYYLDNRFNTNCNQLSSKTYQKTLGDSRKLPPHKHFDVGHLVNKNHLDYSQRYIDESMVMGNMHPQVRLFNQRKGAWYYTEKLVECLRQISPLHVWAGVIIGNSDADDYFVNSHGVKTPSYSWKLIHRTDINKIQIFVMPNSHTSIAENIDSYVIGYADFVLMLEDSFVRELVSRYEKISADINTWVVEGHNTLMCEGIVTSIK